MANEPTRTMILCSGMQSGGTSLISWCFLQHKDINGILDLPHDILKPLPDIKEPYAWVKTTSSSFRWEEAAEYYLQHGYNVKPLLIIRDPRCAFSSLRIKKWGINGTTAGDPPLRIRFLRFYRDWELFEASGWPIIKFEAFVNDPESTLIKAVHDLGLNWDQGMIDWKKSKEDITDPTGGNDTFLRSLPKGDLQSALIKSTSPSTEIDIPADDLGWLEMLFHDFLSDNGYPPHMRSTAFQKRSTLPQYSITRRASWLKLVKEENILKCKLQRLKNNSVIGSIIYLWGRVINKEYRDI